MSVLYRIYKSFALVKILDAHSPHISVALLGEYGVGKTALLQAALRKMKKKGIKVKLIYK